MDAAKRVAMIGVDGIVLSNHGGRQLDRAPVPFRLLPTVVREVGRNTEIHLDTGIMNGADIVASSPSEHASSLIGRAYSTVSQPAGEPESDRTIHILTAQITRTMRLLGAGTLDELNAAHITQFERLGRKGADVSGGECP